MRERLLKKVQVASGKTAGIIARETLAVAKRAGTMPGLIKTKTAEAIWVGGKTLRIKRLKSDLKKWEKKRGATFTKMGEVIFKLIGRKVKNVWQRREIKHLIGKLRNYDNAIRKIKAQITQTEKISEEQISYHQAILNLNSKENNVRLGAVKSLGQLGDKDVIPILTKKLKDPDLLVRQETMRVLHKIIDREYPQHRLSGSGPG